MENQTETKLMRDGIEVLIYKVPTDKDLKAGQMVFYQNRDGFYAFLGTIDSITTNNNVLNYAIDTAIGTYIASELRLIKQP